MRVRTLHHVGLAVDDLDEARRYYSEVLGLKIHPDRPAELADKVEWMEAGDQRVALAPTSHGADAHHFAMVIEDMEETLATLRANGIEFSVLNEPLLNVIFEDPWGNWIELRQPPEVWARHFGS